MKLYTAIVFLIIITIPQFGRAVSATVAPKTYDLVEFAFLSTPKHTGVLNQFKNVTFLKGKSSDGVDIFTLKAQFTATYNGTSFGQATELMAMDVSGTTQILIPKNQDLTTGERKCIPLVSGDTASFNCMYRASENKTLPNVKLLLLLRLPNDLDLVNPTSLDPKDFVATADDASKVDTQLVAESCKEPKPVRQIDGSCGVDCSGNEEKKDNVCVCKTGFAVETTSNACIPSLNVNDAQQPATSGNNCALSTTPTLPNKAILALLLVPMLAATACRFSKS